MADCGAGRDKRGDPLLRIIRKTAAAQGPHCAVNPAMTAIA